jgi:hypothetical protein
VITEQDASTIAAALLGRPKDHRDRPWDLEEFSDGWLIIEKPPAGELFVGAASVVIERETGQVRRFPSSVPPMRITREYSAVRDRGHEQRTDA